MKHKMSQYAVRQRADAVRYLVKRGKELLKEFEERCDAPIRELNCTTGMLPLQLLEVFESIHKFASAGRTVGRSSTTRVSSKSASE